jgi:uncharacterized membrane protein YphA (DoxX/SURF4 family)
MEDRRMNQAWLALRIALGVVPVVAGLDKFFNLLTNWEQYLNPFARRLLPVSDVGFMRAAGIVEIVVGLMILTRWTRLGAYIASAWLALITINLLATGHYFDIAARDAALAVGAFALAKLQEVRSGAHLGVTGAVGRPPIQSPAHV